MNILLAISHTYDSPTFESITSLTLPLSIIRILYFLLTIFLFTISIANRNFLMKNTFLIYRLGIYSFILLYFTLFTLFYFLPSKKKLIQSYYLQLQEILSLNYFLNYFCFSLFLLHCIEAEGDCSVIFCSLLLLMRLQFLSNLGS